MPGIRRVAQPPAPVPDSAGLTFTIAPPTEPVDMPPELAAQVDASLASPSTGEVRQRPADEPPFDDVEYVEPSSDDLAGQVAALRVDVARLTEALRIVGLQQQWTTDTIGQIHTQFQTAFASGNPLKAMMAFLNPSRKDSNG